MAEGHSRNAWTHTAELLAALWSGNPHLRKPKVLSAADFNPYMRKKSAGIPVTNIRQLKALVPRDKC